MGSPELVEAPAQRARGGQLGAASCVACGAPLREARLLGAQRLARCTSCGSATALPRPSAAELAALHDSEPYFNKVYFEARRGERPDTARRVERLLDLVRRACGDVPLTGRRMLDVGCDTGDFLAAARARAGVEPFGVDVSTRAVEIARRRGLTVAASDIADAPDDFGDFALVTAIDLIEHVAEPARLLEDIRSRLAPDGLVYLETPNWCSAVYRVGETAARLARSRPRPIFERLFPPEHVQYFTPAGIGEVVARSGFRPLLVSTRRLPSAAVAGSPLVRAGTWLAQLPDRGDRGILICALLRRERRA